MSGVQTAKDVFQLAGFSAVIIAVLKFFIDMKNQAQNEDELAPLSNKIQMGYFASKRPSWFSYLLWAKTKPLKIPTIQQIVEYGDDLLITSSVFDEMKSSNYPLWTSWVVIFSEIFDTIAMRCFSGEISARSSLANNEILSKACERRQKDDCNEVLKRQLLYRPNRKEGPFLVNCVRVFEGFESEYIDGPPTGNSLPVAIRRPVAFRKRNSTSKATDKNSIGDEEGGTCSVTFLSSGKPSIQVSREELSAFALMLGISLRSDHPHDPQCLRGEGAFGFALSAKSSLDDVHWQLHLCHTKRRNHHLPSKGSGYSMLYAKYMACGNLPFSRSTIEEGSGWIKSVYIGPCSRVESALREGGNIIDSPSDTFPDPVEYLRRLPCSRNTRPWPHYEVESELVKRNGGLIKKRNGRKVGTWWQTVAGIAFGGLVPQTTAELKASVIFTTSGLPSVFQKNSVYNGGNSLDCAEELERLINEVHHNSEKHLLFGSYVHERVKWCDPNYSLKSYSTLDAAAVFARYMTLLERLAALASNTSHARIRDVFMITTDLLDKSYKFAVTNGEGETSKVNHNLGLHIRDFRLRFINTSQVSAYDVAMVAACIIAAWASKVPVTSLVPKEIKGSRDPEHTYMEDLPAFMALT